jgi:hypothetical protein
MSSWRAAQLIKHRDNFAFLTFIGLSNYTDLSEPFWVIRGANSLKTFWKSISLEYLQQQLFTNIVTTAKVI